MLFVQYPTVSQSITESSSYFDVSLKKSPLLLSEGVIQEEVTEAPERWAEEEAAHQT